MRWFAKLFGGRAEAVEEDEPARYATPQISKPAQPVAQSRPRPAADPTVARKGFDPYNSGAFQRSNAWERVGRR